MPETLGPSTMLPDWVSWAVALFGILLILWPYLFLRKPKPATDGWVQWDKWGKPSEPPEGTRRIAVENPIILDSWEPKWPEGQSKEKP